ncbi:hypothetical protein SHJG_5409 [Streptomyces hygroscopicus subsp. jinggangensis 5008]|nr:hypothetical protein SHJG_5409 [Streptomyces hygroscopicus subsp. jinggangensis 5008]AGF64835.1 hypothetical protein SHJGH_5172 [Streptomyces hygroscopicus subsp. jinggangensis TL01]
MRSSLGSFVSAQSIERPNSTTLLPHGETSAARSRPLPSECRTTRKVPWLTVCAGGPAPAAGRARPRSGDRTQAPG